MHKVVGAVFVCFVLFCCLCEEQKQPQEQDKSFRTGSCCKSTDLDHLSVLSCLLFFVCFLPDGGFGGWQGGLPHASSTATALDCSLLLSCFLSCHNYPAEQWCTVNFVGMREGRGAGCMGQKCDSGHVCGAFGSRQAHGFREKMFLIMWSLAGRTSFFFFFFHHLDFERKVNFSTMDPRQLEGDYK